MGYKISYYDHAAKKLAWRDDATLAEYEAWKAKMATGKSSKAARKRATPPVSSETLEDTGPAPEPIGPGRKGGPNTKPSSILAPALPRLAQALAQVTRKASHSLTRGKAPMTPQEAAFVAIPAVRILDRTAAKYVKSTGVVTPNQEDTAIIVVTVSLWLLGWLISVLTGKPDALGPAVTNVSNIPPQAVNDLFSGSEPVGPSPAAAPAAPAVPAADEGDLFTGSEPLAADNSAPVAPAAAVRVDPRAAAIADAVWTAVTPTDRGEALAG